jgi:glycosyltransferase involved in cell wall biosynthesis
VHPNSELYGSDRVFLSTLEALVAVPGVELTAVLPQEGLLAEEIRRGGIPLEVRPFAVLRKVEMKGLRAAFFPLRWTASLARSARWLRNRRADVVYVSTVACPEWIAAGRLARCRVVCHVHESEPDMKMAARRVLLAPLSLTAAIVANSEATRAWIASVVAPSHPVTVLYNGVPAPNSSGGGGSRPEDDVIRLLVVGRISHRKGQDVALEAAALLRSRGYRVVLTLLGDCYRGYESYLGDLRRLVLERDLGDAVHFAGYSPDPGPFLAASDVLLVPSRVEPFGNVAVEGLLSGIPTVVSRVGGLGEIVRDGVTGLSVPPGDPTALADAVAGLIDDRPRARAMAAAGRADAQERFSPERYEVGIRAAVLGSPA